MLARGARRVRRAHPLSPGTTRMRLEDGTAGAGQPASAEGPAGRSVLTSKAPGTLPTPGTQARPVEPVVQVA